MAGKQAASADKLPERPAQLPEWELPPIPEADASKPDETSVKLSAYRTRLSHHRTHLSMHRTDLSEYRTSLSDGRTEMSKRRTGMSFQRTRMSADRTLMSIIRTSLSLIGFGFTIFQIFSKALALPGVKLGARAPHNFGLALVALGVVMLAFGIVYHVRFMRELRANRATMTSKGLIHGESGYPVSVTLLTAVALFAIGLLAIASMVFDIAPFD